MQKKDALWKERSRTHILRHLLKAHFLFYFVDKYHLLYYGYCDFHSEWSNSSKEAVMAKSLTEMAAEISAAQASHATMSAEEMEEFLKKTFQTLQQIKLSEEGAPVEPVVEPEEAQAVDPMKSIQRNKVLCLECGKEFKQLSQAHLRGHGLTAKEYRKKHGFSARQPLAAKSLSAKRRRAAKALGLGERLKTARGKRK
jgi:predicted transcriptional regulator